MNSKLRAETIVQTLEQYLGAREAATQNGGSLGAVRAARGFLVISLEMLIDEVRNVPELN
jgi:hypothetical protein